MLSFTPSHVSETHMHTREIFETGCQRIYEDLKIFGFKATQKGQTLTKPSLDKKLKFEIHFQSSTRNWSGSVALWPFVSISSLALKKWQREKYNSADMDGGIFSTRLENLTPLKNKNYNWNMALNNQDNIIPQLCDNVKNFVLPLFEKFENTDQVIREITEKGMKFNEHFDAKGQNLPVDFLCCFGNKEIAQRAFNNYLKEQKLLAHAQRVYGSLSKGQRHPYKFITDMTMEKAFLNDLKIEV